MTHSATHVLKCRQIIILLDINCLEIISLSFFLREKKILSFNLYTFLLSYSPCKNSFRLIKFLHLLIGLHQICEDGLLVMLRVSIIIRD